MAYASLTFTSGEVPTHTKLNQIQANVDAVRISHKGGSPPAEPVAGTLWLDDSSSPWRLKIYNGTDWDHLLTVIGAREKKNICINGGFDIWQRGASFTASGYTADQWKFTLGTSAVVTVSRQAHSLGQISVPKEPKYFLRIARTTTGSTSSFIVNVIEGVRTLAGGFAALTFWARTSTSSTPLTIKLNQVFGTGGSPSTTVVTTISSVTLTTSIQKFSLVFTVPSISGKVIGSNLDDYVGLQFEMSTSAGVATVDISNINLVEGNIASEFEKLSIDETLQICQRYYYKTFDIDTAPANSLGTGLALRTVGANTGRFVFGIFPPVTLYKNPTVTTYNPGAANSSARNVTDSTDTSVSVTVAKPYFVGLEAASLDATDANDTMAIQAVLDASIV